MQNEEKMKKMEEDFAEFARKSEEEIAIRIKFEGKINDLHSLHRHLTSRYERSLEDI